MATSDPVGPICIVVFVVLALTLLWWTNRRASSLADQWALENGFTVLSREVRYVRKGPFFWTSSRGQTVYYVTVQDEAGVVRKGWVRCGGYLLGLISSQTDVRWDE